MIEGLSRKTFRTDTRTGVPKKRGPTFVKGYKAAARMWDVVNMREGLNEDLIDSDKVPTHLRLFLHAKRSSKHGDKDLFDCKVRFLSFAA